MIAQNLKEILGLYEMAYSAIIQLSDSKNTDNIEYAEILKENIIDSIVCIIHGSMYDDQPGMAPDRALLVRDHFPKIQSFIKKATNTQYNPTIEFVRECLALLTDMYTPNIIKDTSILDKELVLEMIRILNKNVNHRGVQSVLSYAYKNLLKINPSQIPS